MNIISAIKKGIDSYYGDLNTYGNGFEKFFKQYAGLILGAASVLFAWSVDAIIGVGVALFSLYICKFLQSGLLRAIGRACCGVTIFLFILWLWL